MPNLAPFFFLFPVIPNFFLCICNEHGVRHSTVDKMYAIFADNKIIKAKMAFVMCRKQNMAYIERSS